MHHPKSKLQLGTVAVQAVNPSEIREVQPQWTGRIGSGEWNLSQGDARRTLATLPDASFDCVVTSPPYYWQRDYEAVGQLGLEPTIAGYVRAVADVMDEVFRVLADDGLLFLTLGDTYYSAKGQPKGRDRKNAARRFGLRAVDSKGLGVPKKTAIGIPWRVALEMINRGWTLRAPIIWTRKYNAPEPTARDRPWRCYETVFMFAKSTRYHFNRLALPKDAQDVWVTTERPRKAKGIHFAVFPEQLVEMCLDVGCKKKGRVLDPFAGSGTVLRVAAKSGRPVTGIELSEKFCQFIVHQLASEA